MYLKRKETKEVTSEGPESVQQRNKLKLVAVFKTINKMLQALMNSLTTTFETTPGKFLETTFP